MSEPQKFDNSKLDKLVLKGAKEYALQDYERATESFSDACQLYSELHGGADSPRLLYYYGRALYQVGVSKSDVFGTGKDDGKEEEEKDGDEEEGERKSDKKNKDPKKDEKSNKFQFEEDEMLEKQQEESKNGGDTKAEEEKEEEEAPEQSDLEAAWEILDTARALFIKEIEKAKAEVEEEKKDDDSKSDEKKETTAATTTTTKQAKIEELEKGLADTFDVLGEVSLESEDFNQAVQDFTQSLLLKKRLYEPTSTHLSEGYFKLSLAYEFCVVEKDTPEPTEETLAIPVKPSSIPDSDEASKNPKNKYILLAISAMEQAISVVTEREKQGLNQDKTLLKDLISRQNDLKLALKQDTQAAESQKKEVLEGILGTDAAAAASSADALKQTLLQAITKANDVSGLVRKSKKKKQQPVSTTATSTDTTTSAADQPSLKRELEHSETTEESSEKKTKLDEN